MQPLELGTQARKQWIRAKSRQFNWQVWFVNSPTKIVRNFLCTVYKLKAMGYGARQYHDISNLLPYVDILAMQYSTNHRDRMGLWGIIRF